MSDKPRTVGDFRAKHDAKSIIAKLEKDLATAQGEIGIRDYVKDLLGTADLDKKLPAWIAATNSKSGSPGVPTLFLSDLHWGETVFKAQLGGVNEYSLPIAVKRLEHTVQTAIYLLGLLDKNYRYPGIVLPLGGDMISGDIHEELSTTNELPSIPTVLHLHDQLVPTIKLLADRFGRVFLPCVSGNHGRNTRKIQAKNRNATSFDWMLYQMLVRRFADDSRVTFYVPEGHDALYRVTNTTYNLTHGDQFKAGDSIIGPIGPLMRGNQKKTAKHRSIGKPYDVMICGHWHRYIHLSDLIVNSTMKGYDEYADANNYPVEPPQQALWVTHPRFGVNWRMPVLCEQPAPSSKSSEWVSLLV
jgi:hypothetical protein